MRTRFNQSQVGTAVKAQRDASSEPVEAVLVDANELGVACIARLRKDGTMREEALWTALWFDVWAD